MAVEGFFDVFKLYQNGYPNAVALMGSSISSKQASILKKTGKRIIVMLDGDEAGKKGTKEVIKKLRGKQPLKIIRLRRNAQPEETPKEILREIMEWDSKNLYSFFYLC